MPRPMDMHARSQVDIAAPRLQATSAKAAPSAESPTIESKLPCSMAMKIEMGFSAMPTRAIQNARLSAIPRERSSRYVRTTIAASTPVSVTWIRCASEMCVRLEILPSTKRTCIHSGG